MAGTGNADKSAEIAGGSGLGTGTPDLSIEDAGGGGGGGEPVAAAHVANGTDAHDASAVSNVPAGGIVSTDVQGALNGVDTRLTTAEGTLADHSARHENGGADEISLAGLDGVPAELTTHAAAADPHGVYVLESLFDAKGDLIAASAADTPAKVTVGANDTVLTADSTVAAGVKWAAPASSGAVELAYNEFTSAVTISATTEAGATTVVTADAFTASGSQAVVIEFFAHSVNDEATATLCLYLDGSSIGKLTAVVPTTTGNYPVSLKRRLTPASGSRTYSIRVFNTGGAGSVKAGAGGSGNFVPGFIRITTA